MYVQTRTEYLITVWMARVQEKHTFVMIQRVLVQVRLFRKKKLFYDNNITLKNAMIFFFSAGFISLFS